MRARGMAEKMQMRVPCQGAVLTGVGLRGANLVSSAECQADIFIFWLYNCVPRQQKTSVARKMKAAELEKRQKVEEEKIERMGERRKLTLDAACN